MVELTLGNLLEAQADALVNTVNCVGVMGKGVALQFKQAFPENFQQYERACRHGEVKPGQMFIVERLVRPRFIINFPTKRHWKGKARLADIESGLRALVEDVKRLRIGVIAVPPLGCGNGGLEWADVRPRIEAAFARVPEVRVLLFEPFGAPQPDEMRVATDRPGLTRARALLLELLAAYAAPGYKASLLELQKLAYLLQAAGEQLKLKFTKHIRGPYAEPLNQVLQRLEGHYIRGYGDRSGHAGIYLLPGAVESAAERLSDEPGTADLIARVSRVIEGFETPYGMELLATVHWVAMEFPDVAEDPEAAIRRVKEWSARKRVAFRDEHIRKAWRRLHGQGWLSNLDALRAAFTA
ncbi:MAG TPA: macro domain-containing protein [Candidatus Acidoferrum sp.]|nr:macro domain-containing protein [Candidatus Acidoferrum sp.]